MLGSTIFCRFFGLEVPPNAKIIVAVPSVKKYDLLPLLWSRSGAPVRRYAAGLPFVSMPGSVTSGFLIYL